MTILGGDRSARKPLVWLGLLCLSVGCAPQQAAKQERKPVAVRTVAVAKQDVRRTSTQPATVHPYYRAQIQARVAGYVKELQVDIGDVVEQGDVLAVIAVPEMESQREIVKARVNLFVAQETQAKAGLELAKANVESAKAKLMQAEAEAKSTQAALAAADAEFKRTEDLVQRQSLQTRVLDEVRKKRDSERARKAAAESAIVSAQADVSVAAAKQASAEANVTAAQAETKIADEQLNELEVMLSYATLRAPFAGVVTNRSIDVGDLVDVGGKANESLLVVSQVNKLRIHVPVPEVDAAHVDPGDVVTVTFPSFAAEDELKTTVTRVAGSLDPSTRTMLVEAEVDNPDGKLLPGMFGQASIALSTKVAASMLPARAVRFGEDGAAYVYLVEAETAKKVDVTTGVDDGQSIEILSGLSPGQHVIDAHLKRFTTGQKITRLN